MTAVPAQYVDLLNAASSASGVPQPVAAAQIDYESSFNPNAVSPTGAQGIAQFEPYTWPGYGTGSAFDPANAFPAYGRYMKELLTTEHGDLRNALAAYNAGPGNLGAGYGYADHILSVAGTGNQTIAGTGGGAATAQPASLTSDIAGGLLSPLTDFVAKYAVKVGLILGGGVLALIGMWIALGHPVSSLPGAVSTAGGGGGAKKPAKATSGPTRGRTPAPAKAAPAVEAVAV